SNAYGYPMLIGCVMVGREIHRPFAIPYEECKSTDFPLIVLGGNCEYRYFLTRLKKENLLEFTCTMESGVISGRAKSDYGGKNPVEVVWEGKLVGDRIEGTSAMIVPGGKRLERPMVGLLRNTPNAGLDHQNAIYQLERNVLSGRQTENYLIVVEFANGKPVAALARLAEGDTALVDVDANGMTVTPQPATLSGRSAVLGGTLVVDGKPLTLDPVEVRPNGWVAKETEDNKTWYGLGGIRTRAYHNTDPVAKRWKEWMSATYTGPQALSSELTQQVAQETAELEALPFPGPATAFTHHHIGNGQGKNSFIYAPWLNFTPVKDAASYRFECKGKGIQNKKTYLFEAISPTASLQPIWKDLPGSEYQATCTALDAAGKSLGEPQKWMFEKRATFADAKRIGKPIPDPIATQLALRFPRTLAFHHYAQWPLFDLVFGAGMSPQINANLSYCMRDPSRCLIRWSDLPAERTAVQRGLNAYWTAIAQETENPLGLSIGYYSMYFCTVQDWGREAMDDFEVTGKTDRLQRLQRSLGLLQRIQQPSGSWTLGNGGFLSKNMFSPVWAGGFTLFKTAWLDHNSAAYSLGYGRYRHLSGDTSFMDCEIKANHWVARNALRTGYWETQIQQGDGGC
ncbi:MAG: Ig-like domain-containing protein, partial [Phycisphaerae bacterium]